MVLRGIVQLVQRWRVDVGARSMRGWYLLEQETCAYVGRSEASSFQLVAVCGGCIVSAWSCVVHNSLPRALLSGAGALATRRRAAAPKLVLSILKNMEEIC